MRTRSAATDTRDVRTGTRPLSVLATLLIASALAAGCADKHVTLEYQQQSGLPPLASPKALTIFPFSDRRGSEGDHDPLRVGGVYTHYGNRVAKVMTGTPWSRTLAEALAEGFRARGVKSTVEGREFAPGSPVATPLALAGEIHNFSTESRWSTEAHISGTVRLYDRKGALLVEKTISDRETVGIGGPLKRERVLEEALNRALAQFVSKVVTDPEIAGKLAPAR